MIFHKQFTPKISAIVEVEPVYQLLVFDLVNGLDNIVGNPAIFLGFLNVAVVYRRAHHINVDGFFKTLHQFVVFVQKLPTVHDRHINIQENHIWQFLLTALHFLFKETNGFTSVVKGQYIPSKSGRLENFSGSKLIDFIVVYQTNIVLCYSHCVQDFSFIGGYLGS